MRPTRVVIALLLVVVAVLGVRAFRDRPTEVQAGSLVKTVTFKGARFDVVELPLDEWDVRISWTSDGGVQLKALDAAVRTNAGIFEPGFVPTGLLVSEGVELRPLATREGEGNFFLQPNGVFALGPEGAIIRETNEYASGHPPSRYATQSGPLLVRAGVLHPKFNPNSENRALRSGVGVRDAKHVVLVISRDDVNLFTFAALFRDALKCDDALYLDGVISALWAEGAGREADLDKGPFAGVVTAAKRQ
ncbi:MAG: phosphodiester glycosidase family protein [Archangium sp.]